MKAEFDKEIDALLRRSLRAAGRGERAPHVAPPTPHLDADELGAFAENALPAPARRAAVAHLADCDECRGAAVTLSRAAGELEKRAFVPVAVDPSEVAGGGWLAAFFSPRLLRFVAPALALCLVGAVAFVILRTRQGAGEVAQQAAAPEAPRPGIVAGDGGSEADARANMNANMGTSMNANMNMSTGTTANTAANVAPHLHDSAVTPPAAEPGRPAPSGNAVTVDGVDSSDADAAKQPPADTPKTVTAAPPPPPPAVAAEARPVAPAPTPPPVARDAQKRKKEDDRKGEDDEIARADEVQQARRGNLGEAQQQMPDGGSRNRSSNNVYGGGRGAMRREPERSSRSVTGSRARGAEGAGAARGEAETAGETRAAGGRRFRREGNAWVDVNYRSSMSMTGVRRGTEAFRALVADIPEIGRIAEQLSGEVITVVRGRAYRIR